MQASLSSAPVAAIYVVANIALGIHLWHGAWSMFQSLGINNPRYNNWRRNFAVGFALVVTAGNLSFPTAIVSGAANDDVCFEQGNRIVSCEEVFADGLRSGAFTVGEFDDLSESQRRKILKAYHAQEDLRELRPEGG
ncbi:MAG: hypothetical protein OSA99_19015, partial [Acidimicrobiales bacterium]|nr:hypothetical protein [Acidimicrobiales bacterium]